ncbi:hypothetical protein [Microlunatus sp. Gsoil 973]|uniref:hypothetical protein n=1 Tax=Microlunatus sp. Gsoil 973 TaxID=2672569 RepID=UPI001E2F2D4B|nr:hypothetical protein [Microlunatus sp. Gsoil 973]
MWRRLKLMGRAFFRRSKVGVVLERVPVTPADPDAEPETIRAQTGTPIVTAVGKPSELIIFANGRSAVADVKLVGEQDAIDALLGSDLSI